MHRGYKVASLPKGKNVVPYEEEGGWASKSVSKFWREKTLFPEGNQTKGLSALRRLDTIKLLRKIRNEEGILRSRFNWLKTEASGELL